jgi:hypothetical protein
MSPGTVTSLNLTVENYENVFLSLSDFEIIFDFGIYSLQNLSLQIPPNSPGFALSEPLQIPDNVAGKKSYKFRYKIYRYLSNTWKFTGLFESTVEQFLYIVPQPPIQSVYFKRTST